MIMAVFLGCSLGKQVSVQDKMGEDIKSHPAVIPEETGIDARTKAAEEFRLRACRLLENMQLDDAINVLEYAVSLDPKEGENYYHLARAWQMKGNKVQALEFNSLAEIYLGYSEEWRQKIGVQKDNIENMK
jgi:predicted Zn-dependent protease